MTCALVGRLLPGEGHPSEPAFLKEHSEDVARRDDELSAVRERGEQLGGLLAGLNRHPAVLSVCGIGLMWGVRMATPDDGGCAGEVVADVRDFALRAGLAIRRDYPDDALIRLELPLTVTAGAVEQAASILYFAVEAANTMSGGRSPGGGGHRVGRRPDSTAEIPAA